MPWRQSACRPAGLDLLTPLDLHELITDEQRQQGIVVRVDGDIERDKHVEKDQGVRNLRRQLGI